MKRILFAFATLTFFTACNNTSSSKSEANYENSKENMEKREKENPTKFIAATAKDKKNLIGQTVVKGSLTNNAKFVTYKDIEIKLSFYTKTKTVVEEDIETIYENIAPGATSNFKSKFFTPKGTDSVGIEVLGAKH
jgi:hypothetical protein